MFAGDKMSIVITIQLSVLLIWCVISFIFPIFFFFYYYHVSVHHRVIIYCYILFLVTFKKRIAINAVAVAAAGVTSSQKSESFGRPARDCFFLDSFNIIIYYYIIHDAHMYTYCIVKMLSLYVAMIVRLISGRWTFWLFCTLLYRPRDVIIVQKRKK